MGREVLGPALADFAWLLLLAARRDGVTRLAFVSRDGELLLRVTELACRNLPWPSPELDYVHLSRVSTALASEREFGVKSLQAAHKVRAGNATVRSLLAYFGLDANQVAHELADHGFSPDASIRDPRLLDAFLGDPRIEEWIGYQRQIKTTTLRTYLEQHRVLGNPACALVDIGWRGSIPNNLAKAFPEEWADTRPRTYYFGYWAEADELLSQTASIVGLVSDRRRANNTLEAASHYLAFLLESICRAADATVVAYQQDSCGEVAPVLADETPQRHSELAGEKCRAPIREGILDCVRRRSEDYFVDGGHEKRRRLATQKRLWRLAFFPTNGELAAATGLVHTEGHRPDWSRPLIDPVLPNPLRSPRLWLHGLSSPWRSGYIAASGGALFSFAYLLFESILTALPASTRRSVENVTRRWGRLP